MILIIIEYFQRTYNNELIRFKNLLVTTKTIINFVSTNYS